MPPRPSFKYKDAQRPLSAIYIGNQSNGNNSTNNDGHASSGSVAVNALPDLPEPPSPVSSVGSGLPSPPATNSTGSGSTGDPGSIAVRRPPASMPSAQTSQVHAGSSDSSKVIPTSSRSSSRLSWKPEEHDVDGPLDPDEDQTMRLKISSGSFNESILQRARSLAQRNKLQLDKIASSKLGRASPPSRSSSRNHRHSLPEPAQVLSGSETEREGDSAVFNSTSTTSSGSKSTASNRVRLSSAPSSPRRARTQAGGSNSGTNSPTRRRKRVSLASISGSAFDDSDDENSLGYDERMRRNSERYEMGAARDRIRDQQDTLRDDRSPPTVNLNSIKKSALGGTRRRSALPREFREGSTDDQTTEPSPRTPYRSSTASSSASTTTPITDTYTPSSSTMGSSTLSRRSTWRSTRGMSEDLRNSPAYSVRDLPSRTHTTPINTNTTTNNSSTSSITPTSASTTPTTPASTNSPDGTAEPYDNSPTILARSSTIGRHSTVQRERRQTLRGGSAESALGGPGGRSLVGEGLRAAGLSRRVGVGTLRERDRDRDRERERGERERTISATAVEIRERDRDRDRGRDRELDRMSLVSGSSNRSRRGESAIVDNATSSPDVFREAGERERRVEWSPESTESFARREREREFSSSLRTLPPRASTSMADYSYTSRSRNQHMRAQHSDSEDDREDVDDYDEREKDQERDGRRELRTYKSAYGMLTSRAASLTRREQRLLERERELGRRERELERERERERERAGSVIGRHHSGSTVTNPTPASTPTPYASSTVRERGERERYSSPFGTTRRTPGGSSQQSQGQSGHSQQSSQPPSEHAKLMVDSLTMFESQVHKLTRVLNVPGTNHSEMLIRNAQTLVVNAERLNTMLKVGNSRALDAQIEAEVEGDYGAGSGSGNKGSLVDVWRKIGGEYREGLRCSDELVRAVTGLLLGVGRVMKEYVNLQHGGSEAGSSYGGTPRGSPIVHGRSISLGEEDVRVRAAGGVSPDFSGVGRESRRSWEPSASSGGGGSSNASVGTGTGSREEALRRLAGVRSDSPLARVSPAFQAVRELDRLETTSPALGASGSGLGLPKVNIPGVRRLFAPSQQREMALVAENNQQLHGSGGDYEPSPSPMSRTRVFDRGELSVPVLSPQQQLQQSPVQQTQEVTSERSRTIPLPPAGSHSQGHAFGTPLRRSLTISGGGGSGGAEDDKISSIRDRQERRRISIAPLATIRAATSNASASASGDSTTSSSGVSVPSHHPPGFSTLTTPSGATTAVTMARTESGTTASSSLYSTAAKPTFSRPEGILGLQQQLEEYRKRAQSEIATGGVMEGAGAAGAGAGASAGAGAGSDAKAGGDGMGGGKRSGNGASLMTPESERESRRKTYGVGSRVGTRISSSTAGGADVGEFGDRGGGAGERGVVDLSVNAADRSAAATIGAAGRKERRRTVTDIWPRS